MKLINQALLITVSLPYSNGHDDDDDNDEEATIL